MPDPKPKDAEPRCAICREPFMGWCESETMKMPTCGIPDHATILNAVCHTFDLIAAANRARRDQPDPPKPIPGLRPEVLAFAHAMEAQLRANDHKPGWKEDDPWVLLKRLEEESGELEQAVDEMEPKNLHNLLAEAADVGNFAMMIADVCGALKTEPPKPIASPTPANEGWNAALNHAAGIIARAPVLTRSELIAAILSSRNEPPKPDPQPDGDVREGLARAIWSRRGPGGDTMWDSEPDRVQMKYKDMADAALAFLASRGYKRVEEMPDGDVVEKVAKVMGLVDGVSFVGLSIDHQALYTKHSTAAISALREAGWGLK